MGKRLWEQRPGGKRRCLCPIDGCETRQAGRLWQSLRLDCLAKESAFNLRGNEEPLEVWSRGILPSKFCLSEVSEAAAQGERHPRLLHLHRYQVRCLPRSNRLELEPRAPRSPVIIPPSPHHLSQISLAPAASCPQLLARSPWRSLTSEHSLKVWASSPCPTPSSSWVPMAVRGRGWDRWDEALFSISLFAGLELWGLRAMVDEI